MRAGVNELWRLGPAELRARAEAELHAAARELTALGGIVRQRTRPARVLRKHALLVACLAGVVGLVLAILLFRRGRRDDAPTMASESAGRAFRRGLVGGLAAGGARLLAGFLLRAVTGHRG